MCDNLKQDRIRCEACRTINLAKQGNSPKPDMAPYEKCSPTQKIDCGRITELPLNPTCIKVCTKEEFLIRKKGGPKMPYIGPNPYGHGKLMYAVKAGLLVGAVYFTYTQGVWGDQQDVSEALARWSEYIRSINTRRPPAFDKCGKVVRKENPESVVAPMYNIYKNFITTCFAGVVKVPLLIKCAYFDYLKEMQKREDEDAKERQILRKGKAI